MSKSIKGLLLIASVMSLSTSMLQPILGLYIVEVKLFSPFWMGVFLTSLSAAKIGIGHFSGVLGDKYSVRRYILFFALVFNMFGLLCLILIEDVSTLFLLAGLFLALGATGFPHVFALTRLQSEIDDRKKLPLNITLVRMTSTISWIIGPPIVFLIVAKSGFNSALSCITLLSALALITGLTAVPDIEKGHANESCHSNHAIKLGGRIWHLAIMNFLVNLANGCYIIAMPLYLTRSLGLQPDYIGFFFGMAAGFEVLFTLLVVYLTRFFGTKVLTVVAMLCGTAFYSLLALIDGFYFMLALQVLNGAFIGITVALFLITMQDELPDHPSVASSLYANSLRAGTMVAGLAAGSLLQWVGFVQLFIFCALLSAYGLCMSIRLKNA